MNKLRNGRFFFAAIKTKKNVRLKVASRGERERNGKKRGVNERKEERDRKLKVTTRIKTTNVKDTEVVFQGNFIIFQRKEKSEEKRKKKKKK